MSSKNQLFLISVCLFGAVLVSAYVHVTFACDFYRRRARSGQGPPAESCGCFVINLHLDVISY